MGMTEWTWKTKDGIGMFGREWQPSGDPKSIVALVHGLGEHSGRYGYVGTELNSAGHALAAFDLRGHGKSEGERGDASSYEALLDDIDVFVREAAARHPDLPVFVYGHSMGGNLALNFILRRAPAIAGAIVTSPWLRLTRELTPFMSTLALVLGKIAPTLIRPSGVKGAGLSHDAEVVKGYSTDPLNHGRISIRLLNAIRNAGLTAIERAPEFPVPLLLMHGTDDPVTSPAASREFAERARGDVTFRQWEGLLHEIHQEPERDRVVGTMIEWLGTHVPR
jgi:alpha-beta hydrolase superfamily lysophospholipase